MQKIKLRFKKINIKKILLAVVLGLVIVSCNKGNHNNEHVKKSLKDPKDMNIEEISHIIKKSNWAWVYNTAPFTSDFSSLIDKDKQMYKEYVFKIITSYFNYKINEKNYNTQIIPFVKAFKKVLLDGDQEMLEKFKSIDVSNNMFTDNDRIEHMKSFYFTDIKDLEIKSHNEIIYKKDINLLIHNKFSLELNDSKTDYILINKGYTLISKDKEAKKYKALLIRIN